MKKVIRTKNGFRVTPINRRRACRLMCLECMGWENADQEVDNCNGEMLDGSICPLVSFRKMGDKQNSAKRKKAIMNFCLECMGNDKSLVSKCTAKFCPVFAYRNSKTDKSVFFDSGLDDKTVLEMCLQ